jgi:hypothetical protein
VGTRTSFTRSFLARHRRAYNTLIDVDVAYARLRRNRRQLRAIRAALRLIAEHRANRFLGVTLLHRHFRAAPNAVFVERRFTPTARRHRTLLVTSPMPVAVAPRRLAPHRFAFTGAGVLQPLEFTTAPAAIGAYARIAEDERLHTEVAGILAECGAGSLLGLGIFARAVGGPRDQRLPRGDAFCRAPVGRLRAPAPAERAGPAHPHAVDVGLGRGARLRGDLPGVLHSPEDRHRLLRALQGPPRRKNLIGRQGCQWRWIR